MTMIIPAKELALLRTYLGGSLANVIGVPPVTDGHLAVFDGDVNHIKDGGPVSTGAGDVLGDAAGVNGHQVLFDGDGYHLKDGGLPGGGAAWVQTVTEIFTNLAAWTIVDDTWSVASNILSKTGNGFGDLFLTSQLFIGPCIMEAEIRCVGVTVPSDTHLGLMWCWDGSGSNAPNSVYCRLLFRTDGTLAIQFEAAGSSNWGTQELGSWVQNTWYKLRAVFNGWVFQAFLNGVVVFAIRPDQGVVQQPKYIGLRGGDTGSSTDMQVRNFNLWVPVLP